MMSGKTTQKPKVVSECCKTLGSILILSILIAPYDIDASIHPLPKPGEQWIGEFDSTYLEPGETLQDIADRYQVDLEMLKMANPKISTKKSKAWQLVRIPPIILPDLPQYRGIVINLAERKLYHFSENDVAIFKVGVGRDGWESPEGESKIVEKIIAPTWYPPKSIREYMYAKHGKMLPVAVDPWPNPENPLGPVAMRLGFAKHTYLIHGTNDPKSVGKFSSSGCFRMLSEDAQELFARVKVGTPVTVVNEFVDGETIDEFYNELQTSSGLPEISSLESDWSHYKAPLREWDHS